MLSGAVRIAILTAESKHPYGRHRGGFQARFLTVGATTQGNVTLVGMLRLRTTFASRRSFFAQHDSATGAYPLPCFFSTFAQVSFNATVRLKTGFPGFESGSALKYPKRSNW